MSLVPPQAFALAVLSPSNELTSDLHASVSFRHRDLSSVSLFGHHLSQQAIYSSPPASSHYHSALLYFPWHLSPFIILLFPRFSFVCLLLIFSFNERMGVAVHHNWMNRAGLLHEDLRPDDRETTSIFFFSFESHLIFQHICHILFFNLKIILKLFFMHVIISVH